MFKLEAFFVSVISIYIPVLCRSVTERIFSFVSVTMSDEKIYFGISGLVFSDFGLQNKYHSKSSVL